MQCPLSFDHGYNGKDSDKIQGVDIEVTSCPSNIVQVIFARLLSSGVGQFIPTEEHDNDI